MNRFDDKWTWRVVEKVGIPVFIAIVTAAIIWGSVKEKIENLERADAGNRITRLETRTDDLKQDVTEIKRDVKEILRSVNGAGER